MAGCVDFISIGEYQEGMSDEYIIYFFMGNDNPILEMNVKGYELCQKMFDIIWGRLVAQGYCDLDKFNEDGDYIDYGILH